MSRKVLNPKSDVVENVVENKVVETPVVAVPTTDPAAVLQGELLSAAAAAELLGFDAQVKQLNRIAATVERKLAVIGRQNARIAKKAEREKAKAERAVARAAKKKDRVKKSETRLVSLAAKVKAAGYNERDIARLLGIKID